jgi:hypothetical protein
MLVVYPNALSRKSKKRRTDEYCAKRDEQEWCLTVYLETALTSLRKEFRRK